MNIFGLGIVAAGYAFFYWALNILVQSYKRTTTMNPPPLSVCFGIPGSDAANPMYGGGTQDASLSGAPPDNTPMGTPPDLSPSFDPNTPNYQGQ